MRWWWTGFWEQMNLQDFTSVWDLLELLFAEILQFVSQLMDRFSQIIKREERTEEIIIYVCRFRRSWERLETLQKTEIITHQLHTSPNNLHQHQIWLDWSLVTHLNPALSQHQLHSSHIHYITLELHILVFAAYTLCELFHICFDDKTSAKNINVHLTAQAHQLSLIVGLSRFAQEKQLKDWPLFITLEKLDTMKLQKDP